MICPNCHKEYDNNLPSCKYCGRINVTHPRNRYLKDNNYSSNSYNQMMDSMKKLVLAGGITIVIVIILIIVLIILL